MCRFKNICFVIVLLSIICNLSYGGCSDGYRDSGYYDSAEYVLSDIGWSIESGDKARIKEYIKKHKAYKCKDGKTFLEKVFEKCLSLAKKKSVKFRNIISSAKIIIKNGLSYKKYINKIMEQEDYRESLFLDLFIEQGLRDKKILTKIARDAIRKKKPEVLEVVLKSGVKLARSVRRKIRRAAKQINIIVLHSKVLKDLKKLFKKKNPKKVNSKKNKNKNLTQTEGFLKVWFNKKGKVKDYDALIKKMLDSEYVSGWYSKIDKKDLSLYVNMIKEIAKKEREYGDYYAFYHAHSNNVGFVFDIQTSIRKWFQLEISRYKDIYMRFKAPVEDHNTLQEFMEHYDQIFKPDSSSSSSCMYYSGWNDHSEPLRSQILCVNPSIFGNTKNCGECTLDYFINKQSISDPSAVVYKIFEDLGFDKKYIDRLHDVYNRYMLPKKGGNVLQVLIPKDQVDNFVYLSRAMGTPFDEKISGISYDKKKKRHKNISKYLHKLVTKPFSIKLSMGSKSAKNIINEMQCRIVFMPKFYDLETGIKVMRYNFVSKEDKKKYKEAFEKIVDEMMSDWIESKGHEKLKENDRNRRLLRLIKYVLDGQRKSIALASKVAS